MTCSRSECLPAPLKADYALTELHPWDETVIASADSEFGEGKLLKQQPLLGAVTFLCPEQRAISKSTGVTRRGIIVDCWCRRRGR